MGQESKIQWTQNTYNPWHGCRKVSPGCKYCYMYRDKDRYGQDPTTVLRSKTNFNAPLKWKEGRLIFTCSWSDFFIEEADEWRDEVWEIIRKTPQHTYQILTKRPERIRDNLPTWPLNNVWIGVSVESQQQVERIPYLYGLPCTTFVSFEPLIGPVKWDNFQIDWCIIGGESGNETGKWKYRPIELPWAEELIKEAKENDVACFVKQLGTYQAKVLGLNDRHGGNMEEWPEHLQVREMPKPQLIVS
jgi:protein gp37